MSCPDVSDFIDFFENEISNYEDRMSKSDYEMLRDMIIFDWGDLGHDIVRAAIARRTFLVAGGVGFGGLDLVNLARGAGTPTRGKKARSCILIWLDGGPSHLDTFDPKPKAPLEYRGPYSPIATNVPGIEICELFPHQGRTQLISAGAMGFMHGTNDAQKTMGIIALALVAGTSSGKFDDLPEWLSFLKTTLPENSKEFQIATWIKLLCAVVMAAGTAAGGWRIIQTLGHKMVRLQPVHGFAAETSSAMVIGVASALGIPVSTTHNISASIMGVGAAKRLNALNWTIVEKMAWAWILTIPISGGISWTLVRIMQATGMMPVPAAG